MSKNKPPKKKVVVTTTNKKKEVTSQKKTASTKGGKKVKPTVSSRGKARASSQPTQELIFHRRHYLIMGLGILLIMLGMLLMSGGSMPSADVWDEGRIYGFRRTVLAPILILAGLGVEIYAIFKK
jgi:hypothetical protein